MELSMEQTATSRCAAVCCRVVVSIGIEGILASEQQELSMKQLGKPEMENLQWWLRWWWLPWCYRRCCRVGVLWWCTALFVVYF